MLEADLKQFGLNKSEAKIYLYLLGSGLSTPPQIAKGTGIARTNCYNILSSLREQGLIEAQANNKRKAYLARDPESIVSGLERRRKAAERLVPELRALYSSEKNKPKIRYFDGWEEVKEIFRETLSADVILALGSTEKVDSVDEKFLAWYTQALDERKIIFRDILTAASEERTAKQISAIRGALHTIKFLPAKAGDLPTDLFVWNDNIGILTLEEPIFGAIITSVPLSQTLRIILELLYEKL